MIRSKRVEEERKGNAEYQRLSVQRKTNKEVDRERYEVI